MDEGEERTPPYLPEKTSPLKVADVVAILKDPDYSRTIRQPPPKPQGGEVYLYKIEDFEDGVWKKDNYYFRPDGKQKQPKNNPVVTKEFYKAYKEDKSTTKRFVKEAFYLCEEDPKYVLVHYRGKETMALTDPKALKRKQTRAPLPQNRKSRKSKSPTQEQIGPRPCGSTNLEEPDEIFPADPLLGVPDLQDTSEETNCSEFVVSDSVTTSARTSTNYQNDSPRSDCVLVQDSKKRKTSDRPTHKSTKRKPDNPTPNACGHENVVPVKHPRVDQALELTGKCEILEPETPPFCKIRTLIKHILRNGVFNKVVKKILSLKKFWGANTTHLVCSTGNPCLSLINEVQRKWSRDIDKVTDRLQWTNLCADVLSGHEERDVYLNLTAAVIVGAYRTGTDVTDFLKTLDKIPSHLENVEEKRCSRNCQYTVGMYTVSGVELLKLRGNTWLTNDILDTYLHLVELEWCSRVRRHCVILPTETFILWEQNRYIQRFGGKEEDLSRYRWVLMPVNLPINQHWVLLVANTSDRTVGVVNSKPGIDLEDRILEQWRFFTEHSNLSSRNGRNVWTRKEYKTMDQLDGHSCGVFVIMAAESILSEEAPAVMRNCHCHWYKQYIQHRIIQYAHSHDSIRSVEGERLPRDDRRPSTVDCPEGDKMVTDQMEHEGERGHCTLNTVDSQGDNIKYDQIAVQHVDETMRNAPFAVDVSEKDDQIQTDAQTVEPLETDGEGINMDVTNKLPPSDDIQKDRQEVTDRAEVPSRRNYCFQNHQLDKYTMACLLLIALEGGRVNYLFTLRGGRGLLTDEQIKHFNWALQAFGITNNDDGILKTYFWELKNCCVRCENGFYMYSSPSTLDHLQDFMQNTAEALIEKMDLEFLYCYMKPQMWSNDESDNHDFLFKLEVGEDLTEVILNRFISSLEEGKFAFVCNHPLCKSDSFVEKMLDKLSERHEMKDLLYQNNAENGLSFLFWSKLSDNSILLEGLSRKTDLPELCQLEAAFLSCISPTSVDIDILSADCNLPIGNISISRAAMKVIKRITTVDFVFSDYYLPNYYSYSLFEFACVTGSLTWVELFTKSALFQRQKHQSCLLFACLGQTTRHTTVTERLLKQIDADIYISDSFGGTPLHYACRAGNVQTVKLILQHESAIQERLREAEGKKNNPTVDVTTKVGLIRLHNAAQNGHREVAELLLQHKASVDATCKEGFTPLHIAALNGHREVAELLLQHKASVDATCKEGSTPLHIAALNGHREVVELLLQHKASVDATTDKGFTPLYIAAQNGHREVVELLLQHKASVDATTDKGFTPLYIAAQNGHREVVELLLQHKASVDATTDKGFTPLSFAAQNGHREVAELLLQHKASVDATTDKGFTPLHIAALNGHREVVELLLQHKASVDATTDKGFTPLYIAAQNGHREVAELLLQHKASVDATCKEGSTPLHIAAQNGHREVVELLLQHKASVDATTDKGFTPLYIAAQNGHREVVELLLQHKASVDATTDKGFTPLYIAAQNGHREVVELLLQHKASVDATCKEGSTPLHIAAQNGHREVVELLLQHKASVDATTDKGFTPLYIAAQNGHREVVELLLQHKASVDATCKEGSTPLHIAALNGHREVVELLLQHKASVDATTDKGFTPLYIAAQNGHREVAELLLQHKASVDATCKEGSTPLHIAALNGHREVVELLLQHKASVDATIDKGFTPLYIAAQNGHREVVELLLQHKASVDATTDKGFTPLYIAAQNGHREVVELLLQHKASVDATTDKGFTPLSFAAQNGHREVAELLLQHKASVDATTDKGFTPLHIAALNGHREVVELLLQHKASVDATTDKGFTPLYIAAQNGHREVAELLLQHKASVDATCKEGSTPLHIAAQNGHREVVELLLQHKASVDATTDKGFTPLYIAAQNGHREVVELLLQHKASVDATTDKGFTPLYIAAQNGHREVVELLLQHKASVDVTSKEGWTPLHGAVSHGQKEVTELLLKRGANMNTVNIFGESPLQTAQRLKHLELVRLLSRTEDTCGSINQRLSCHNNINSDPGLPLGSFLNSQPQHRPVPTSVLSQPLLTPQSVPTSGLVQPLLQPQYVPTSGLVQPLLQPQSLPTSGLVQPLLQPQSVPTSNLPAIFQSPPPVSWSTVANEYVNDGAEDSVQPGRTCTQLNPLHFQPQSQELQPLQPGVSNLGFLHPSQTTASVQYLNAQQSYPLNSMVTSQTPEYQKIQQMLFY